MKRKFVLIGICFMVMIIIFINNIHNKLSQDTNKTADKQDIIARDGNMMTVKESLHLLGCLGIDETDLNQAIGITGDTTDDTEITDNTGTADSKEASSDTEYLRFGDFVSLINLTCDKLNLKSDVIFENISFDYNTEPENKAVLTDEFLRLYECIVAAMPKDTVPVVEKNVFVLGTTTDKSKENSDDKASNNNTMVTDQGNYTYTKAANYENLDPNVKKDTSFNIDKYINCKISVMVSGTELLYVKKELSEDTVLHNVWIVSSSEGKISTFLNDISKEFEAKYTLDGKIERKIADLVIQDKKVVKISIKPDVIGGKVLVANKKYIEIEGYGRIQLDDNFKIYKVYDELSMEITNSILVGYEATDFVVADGKIVAALIKGTINAKDIRVLIKTSNYEDIFHKEVKLTADRDFTVTVGKEKKTYKKGEVLTFLPNDDKLSKGRIKIKTDSENGKIKLLSVKRSQGNPSYRGSIEISTADEGLIVINEVSIEEYLYAVIPSEMPTSYRIEALKAQAICARSYAYNQLFANGYSEYGAHVDDSVSYQVYNNISEDENSILAVKDTYGKVIKYNNSIITAYYFSTSCGHTASLNEVWGDFDNAGYLVGKLQNIEGEDTIAVSSQGKSDTDKSKDKMEDSDLSADKDFREFLMKPSEKTYDSEFPWYRWNVTIPLDDLKQTIDNNLSQRYSANPELIQTLVGKDKNDATKYKSIPINTIGTIENVLVSKREKSGILSQVIIVGSKSTIKVSTEYNIRCLLAPKRNDVTRQDNSVASGLNMLPSAYFVIDKKGNSMVFHGGGYGHGVGMSQNGAKAMADLGKEYQEILKHYYAGVELGYIY